MVYLYRILDGAKLPDILVLPENIPSSDEFDALAGAANSSNTYILSDDPRVITQNQNDALVGPVGYTPNSSDHFATESFATTLLNSIVSNEDWHDGVDYSVNYVANPGTTGFPPLDGALVSGDKAINLEQQELYSYNGVTWVEVTLEEGNRFLFHTSGEASLTGWSNSSGLNNLYKSDFSLEDYNEGATVYVADDANIRTFNGVSWVLLESIIEHQNLSGIQGGGQIHLTADIFDGLDNSVTPLSVSNRALVLSDLGDTLVTPLQFCYRGTYPDTTTDDLPINAGSDDKYFSPTGGTCWKLVASLQGAAPSGSITLKVKINGSPVTNSLDITLNSSNSEVVVELSSVVSAYNFTAGQPLAIEATSDGSWSAEDQDLKVTLYVVFED